MTSRQFRCGYTAIILNNMTGPRTASANCEPDKAVALLQNVHDLIEQFVLKDDEEVETHEVAVDHNNHFEEVICDPGFTKKELTFLEQESLVHSACLVSSKIVDQLRCEHCRMDLYPFISRI